MFASRFAPQLALLGVLVASRLLVHALGFAPDPTVVVDHWQHIDLHFLASDPIGSLWTLHSQPPLWNALLALAVALAGPDGEAVTNVIYGFNLILTAGAGLMFLSVLRRFGFSTWAATLFTSLAMCSPNVFYFETYAFYPHFTFFLVTLLLWLLARVKRDGPLWPMAASIGVLTTLSWTWAIFHPAFIALAGAALVVWHRGWTLKHASRPLMALTAAATLVAALPSIKNQIIYGIPSASTWIGLNLAQTVPGGQTGAMAHCDFEIAQREGVAALPGLPTDSPILTQVEKRPGMPNMNHAGMIATSKRCLDMTKDIILADPLRWIGFRLGILMGTHQLAPSHYGSDPLGWDRVFEPQERAFDSLGTFGRTAMTLWYLVLVWFGAKSIRTNPGLYISLLGVIAYFTFASHFLNGGEQARMRYTIEPIYLFFSAGLLLSVLQRFRVMQSRTESATIGVSG